MCEFMKEVQWVEYNIGAEFDGEALDDYLGFPVSIDSMGDRLAICATLNNGNGVDAGHVRVYEWNGIAWVQSGSDIDEEVRTDLSGISLSMNALGAIRNWSH